MDTKNPAAERLPIKLILPRQGIERKVTGGGSSQEPFRPVDSEYRQRLSNQVSAITQAITPQIAQSGSAPIRVKLIQQALAKSHRPQELFSSDTCPIIGAGKLGELFVKATSQGLAALTSRIETVTVHVSLWQAMAFEGW